MATGRPVLAASLDEETDAALREFCRRHRVTASGLVEAFARAVTSGALVGSEAIVEAAGLIDDERRSRK